MIKPLDDDWSLPECVLVSPEITKGTVCVPVVNVGEIDVIFHSHNPMGLLSQAQIVSLPDGASAVAHKSGSVSYFPPKKVR